MAIVLTPKPNIAIPSSDNIFCGNEGQVFQELAKIEIKPYNSKYYGYIRIALLAGTIIDGLR